ncbi:MAG: amino acid transporter [Firmicutes bacterium]|nr:amino acid transporter [Bacillota bacterium]
MSEEAKLKKVLGLSDALSVAFGQTIGAGIIVLTGIAAHMTGTGIVPGFGLAALAVLLSVVPMAVLGSMFPATGGLYQYTSRLWGPKAGFYYLLLYIPSQIQIAIFALTFGEFFKSLVPEASTQVVGVGILTLMYIANLLGVKVAANVLKFFLINLILALLLFVFYGLPKVHFEVFTISNMFANGSVSFLSAAALLSAATGGAVFVSELGGEMKNPKRDIPLAIILVTMSVGILYSAIGLVASGVLPLSEVKGQLLSEVAQVILPHPLFIYFIVGGALLSVAKMLLLAFTWGPKAILMGCIHGWLPKSLGVINGKFGTPHMLLTVLYVLALIPIVFGISIEIIATLATALVSISFLFPITAAYRLPSMYPDSFKNSAFSLSPNVFKFLVIVAAIIVIGQAVFLLVSLKQSLVVGTAVYLIAALLLAVVVPKREIEYFNEKRESV